MRMNMFLSLALLGLFSSGNLQAQQKTGPKIKTIIVDAGHGGTDVGARGRYSTEAQLTLEMSLRLEKMLMEA